MNKNLLVCSLMLHTFSYIIANDRLYDAINNVDYNSVRYELKGKTITKFEQEKLLEAANNSIDICKNNTRWLIKSFKDMLKLGFGLGLFSAGSTVVGISLLAAAVRQEPKGEYIFAGVGGCVAIAGVKLVTSGWSMTSAKKKFNKAMDIKRLIQDTQIKETTGNVINK